MSPKMRNVVFSLSFIVIVVVAVVLVLTRTTSNAAHAQAAATAQQPANASSTGTTALTPAEKIIRATEGLVAKKNVNKEADAKFAALLKALSAPAVAQDDESEEVKLLKEARAELKKNNSVLEQAKAIAADTALTVTAAPKTGDKVIKMKKARLVIKNGKLVLVGGK